MQHLLVKFETRSFRVKGISFHPKRPWVMIGMHNGVVQIVDYRMCATIDRYEEHDGPVRGVDFHSTQPLFVTGGDDYKIKVWNYKFRRCLFTLTGHLDYIRTVQFHKEQPWILSASDDQTLRIWNWQSRNCMSVLTGHNHYVMSAQFHPREDLIVSASLDLTIRVWDISGLKARRNDNNSGAISQDLFGSSDVMVKFNLEGHEKGVNWASFHPTKPLIVSAADDRSIRIWKMDDTRAYEINQLRQHTNNVSSVMYFKDYIISNSEDRTIRVWDPAQNTAINTYRRDTDRFWTLAAHPESNLIAAGHDNGMMVFKLNRERPAHTFHNGLLHFVRDFTIRTYDFETGQEASAMNMRRHLIPPTTLHCNPSDNMAVAWYDGDGGMFELFTIPKAGTIADAEIKKGFYVSAVFFAAGKFAVLDKTNQIVLRTTGNDISKMLPPVHNSNKLFPGPQGFLICRNDEKVYLFQVAQRAVVAEVSAAGVKYVTWDKDFNRVALQSKHSIVVASRKLKHMHTITESSVRIKSAAFDEERDILFYATSNHLKYCNLRNGECSTIRTLDNPVYLVKARGDSLWVLTREGKIQKMVLDNAELSFKLALQQERFRDVLKIIQSKKLHGQALVGYLHKHGYPEIAMHFVSDPLVRFNLALECGAMDIAKTTAQELNQPEVWRKLADNATRFGDIQLAQLANAKTQNYHSLGLQCVVTGNIPALGHMIDKAKDDSFKLQYSLYTGDVEKRINILAAAGQLPLAFRIAASNGLNDVAESLLSQMDPDVAERCRAVPIHAARPPPPATAVADNWPMLPVQESYFTRMLKEPGMLDYAPDATETKAAWADDDDDLFGDAPEANAANDDEDIDAGAAPAQGGGEWDDDLDIDIDIPVPAQAATGTKGAAAAAGYVVPREGETLAKHWVDNSQLAVYHIAAGSFASALQLFQRQVGLVNAAPLQPYFMYIWASVNGAQPTWSPLPPHTAAATTIPQTDEMRAKHGPSIPKLLPQLLEKIKSGYAAFTEGRFPDAHRIFTTILHMVLFVVVDNKKEHSELMEVLTVSREYIMAVNMELQRKEEKEPGRALEMAAYFSHYKLQTPHIILTLSASATQAFKCGNFKTAANLARRMLDLDPPQERAERARKIIAGSEAKGSTEAIKLDYDDRNPFTLCTVSKKPMYRGTVEAIRCPFCLAPAHPNHRGERCKVCDLSNLGEQAAGMANGSSS
ncbi:coatamer alpha subunit, putative [Bodo saltans]|uniref:Coatomer subunit alpha n=1 Tax=Bodo saltans TaxID=75058 RepID=A0A0S4IPS1_BODSA|nr:coatamer alpha subunit, putative [Bodo saltans]|eukprot:CUF10528.1 coatamer alpha subunit, putative [Bodo saltans]